MLNPKYIPLVFKQTVRRRTSTGLTLLGVAAAMFLFTAVRSIQTGLRRATEESARDTTLVVYREARYCPFTSRLPEDYGAHIAKIPGVRDVTPIKIIVNNCRTSLDVVTFRGVPPEDFQRQRRQSMHILEGSWAAWLRRSDAALIGEVLARRRGAKIGGTLDAAGITVYVAGIVRSDAPQEQNVGYVHLPFLQQSADKRLGIVTQFNVKVHSHDDLERVAAAIDEQFRNEREPTQTSSEQAFVGRAAKDIVEIVEFARWPALACLAAVLALVGNAIVLSVRDRVREHAVLQTLGFKSGLIARLILAEGLLLGAAGGLLGVATLGLVLYFGAFSLTTDAVSIPFQMEVGLLITGVLLAAALGALAGLFPAWQASRREVVESLRAV